MVIPIELVLHYSTLQFDHRLPEEELVQQDNLLRRRAVFLDDKEKCDGKHRMMSSLGISVTGYFICRFK